MRFTENSSCSIVDQLHGYSCSNRLIEDKHTDDFFKIVLKRKCFWSWKCSSGDRRQTLQLSLSVSEGSGLEQWLHPFFGPD